MTDLTSLMERADRAVSRVPLSGGIEQLRSRRDRKRRNQRIAAGVVAIAIVVAPVAWILANGGWSDRASTPAEPAPTVAPDDTRGIGVVGLAPAGATPSSTRRGELVLSFMFGHTMSDGGRFSVSVYEDGRVIGQRLADHTYADEYSLGYTTGLLEQRLTPEGVELVKKEVMSTGLFDHDLFLESGQGLNFGQIDVRDAGRVVSVTWGDVCCRSGSEDPAKEMPTPEQASALRRLDARLAEPASWLPASAWVDPEIRAYVPSRYSIDLVPNEVEGRVGLSRVLASLPPAAEDLLRTLDVKRKGYTNLTGSHVFWAVHLRTDEARALARILDDAGSVRHEDAFGLRYDFGLRHPDATQLTVSFWPLLPHQT